MKIACEDGFISPSDELAMRELANGSTDPEIAFESLVIGYSIGKLRARQEARTAEAGKTRENHL